MSVRVACALTTMVVAFGCTHAEGEFHAEGPKTGTWTMTPDTASMTTIAASATRNAPRAS